MWAWAWKDAGFDFPPPQPAKTQGRALSLGSYLSLSCFSLGTHNIVTSIHSMSSPTRILRTHTVLLGAPRLVGELDTSESYGKRPVLCLQKGRGTSYSLGNQRS